MEQYNLKELVADALMNKYPLILVEGKDDIQIYDKITSNLSIECEIKAIENIPDYGEGNEYIIKAIENLQEVIVTKPELLKYILGIIDRDARFYKDELPELKGLFILKYYSIESNFIARNNLKNALFELTEINSRLCNNELLDYIEKEIKEIYLRLYYVSLEALKNACIKDYSGLIGFSKDIDGREIRKGKILKIIKEESLYLSFNKKKDELDEFASTKNISFNLEIVKFISKGKWLLHVYSDFILNKIKKLAEYCKNEQILQCQYCKTGKYNKCLYKLKRAVQIHHVESMLLNKIDENEFKYIYDRFRLLG